MPGQDDLLIGPLDIVNGRLLPTADPAGWGDDGTYKIPFAVGPYATVTVVIAAQARGYVAIDNPYGPPGGVAAATYHSCQGAWTVSAAAYRSTCGSPASRGHARLRSHCSRAPARPDRDPAGYMHSSGRFTRIVAPVVTATSLDGPYPDPPS
jgi:hypothetical protein